MRIDRRQVLGLLGLGAAAPAAASGSGVRFQHGVASGDPTQSKVVLWTRITPDKAGEEVPYTWELLPIDRRAGGVKRGVGVTGPDRDYTVKVDATGLDAGRAYTFEFEAAGVKSPMGRTRTLPAGATQDVVLAVASCSLYPNGYFNAYQAIADLPRVDVVLHLGDYIYEYGGPDSYGMNSAVAAERPHDPDYEIVSLADYRRRHAQYKTDPDLQAAHAAAPWAVVFDDHEIENNWADEVPERPDPDFLARRAAAFQAYYENLPLRRSSIPRGIDMQLYRRLRWGRLATFHLLDTRQYRDDQGCNDGYKDCPAALDPARSITGAEQEEWLLDGFHRSTARWDVLGQQVFFGQRDSNRGPMTVVSMDAWDGYAASRDRITRGWVEAGVRNPVVLTGDVHAHWADELKLDYADPTSRTVGSELVCSSITSTGDGVDVVGGNHPWAAWNPHLRFYNNQRGYVRTTITADSLTADFQVVPYVTRPGAPVHTRATFLIEDRVPGLQRIADNPTPGSPSTLATDDLGEATVRQETERP